VASHFLLAQPAAIQGRIGLARRAPNQHTDRSSAKELAKLLYSEARDILVYEFSPVVFFEAVLAGFVIVDARDDIEPFKHKAVRKPAYPAI
jgi:hypothetical protein